MITLKLSKEQAGYLEAALEKAMDNEGDAEFLSMYDQLIENLRKEMKNPVDL